MTRPSLPLYLGIYHEAFQTLSRSRGQTMGGVPPIVFSEILHYADEYSIWSAEQRDRLVYHVQALDAVYTQHVIEKMKVDTKTKK